MSGNTAQVCGGCSPPALRPDALRLFGGQVDLSHERGPDPMEETEQGAEDAPDRIRREVTRRDDGVVVVREVDPETGEEVVRRYPPS